MGEISWRTKTVNTVNNPREKGSAAQRGTTVVVRNMFLTMPVRLEQMKKQRVSIPKVKSMILTYGFVREIRFQLLAKGNKRLDWTIQATSDATSVAVSAFGKVLVERYTHTSWSGGGLVIDAILPNPNQGLFLLEVLTKTRLSVINSYRHITSMLMIDLSH